MPADPSIYNALMQPRKSAFDYAADFEDQAFQREQRGTQRQMNALQLQQATQSQSDDQALRNYLAGGAKLDTPEGQAGLYQAAPTKAGAILKDRFSMAKDQAAINKDNTQTEGLSFDNRLKKAREAVTDIAALTSPEEAEAGIRRHMAAGDIDMQKASMLLNSLKSHPNGFAGWQRDMVLGVLDAKTRLEQEMKQREFGLKANNELIGPDGQVNHPLLGAKQQVARAGASSVSINTGQKGLDNEFKLRGEFKSEPVYKAQQEMQSAYAQIQQSLKQASPAGDLAGATKIMKLLDPGSVVRESELGMAMAASGLLDRAQNYASNIISGNKLTPTQRKDFQRLADALYSESVKAYNAKRSEYDKLGGEYGLNAARAIGPAAAAPAGGVVDFNNLK